MDAPLGEWWENPTAQLEEKGKAIQSRNAYFQSRKINHNRKQLEGVLKDFL